MQTHSLPQTTSLPATPRAIADARAVICDPNLAATLPETFRRLAFLILASQHGIRVTQRHRAANLAGPGR
ncbi:hypothetical protein RGQ15_11495 [Paracoccus sp. MBLB3053]|uniref:Uncharacterized protein n=1 Tax=Paracoccus aurantius TaxID=3073814 RepID=A0ABU2HT11_9RHOB|nr:hypothetical protein [Paracoccus sp. MBLB3053]MDS9468190.1 hypothetical protein [Paracoccus sp. MBLB3053]